MKRWHEFRDRIERAVWMITSMILLSAPQVAGQVSFAGPPAELTRTAVRV